MEVEHQWLWQEAWVLMKDKWQLLNLLQVLNKPVGPENLERDVVAGFLIKIFRTAIAVKLEADARGEQIKKTKNK
ncbi:MAG: hypothetical protein CM15mV81_130 [uncultured marine virus]|nr:MAG: hypothetical protein CM15mV81_130 [uncultured marine virus]